MQRKPSAPEPHFLGPTFWLHIVLCYYLLSQLIRAIELTERRSAVSDRPYGDKAQLKRSDQHESMAVGFPKKMTLVPKYLTSVIYVRFILLSKSLLCAVVSKQDLIGSLKLSGMPGGT